MDFDPSRPIWLQLKQEFSRRIAVGYWPAGVQIPGVRELALDLGVNPNTVQRTLAEMERDGLCRSERAVGRFITDDHTVISALRRDLAASAADDFIARCQGVGLTGDDAVQLVTERWHLT
ncbi:GntR family transcriptional regulator [Arachnia propionica]|uniref:GntR family transcriptional regulator n=1 Tax=Arachnia propionica TaxID=1750 RepID=A0A3P1WV02_9ACTN|nr:GntR family transcriptional regulator [Arachnia propionica]RRD50409.1 GntR family transcriptional regulator [Arachnia propionica]